VAGVLLARAKGIPLGAAIPVAAGFLLEYPFYLVTGFASVRERLAGPALPAVLTGSMVLPYLACCGGAIPFHWMALARLAALPLAVSLWYRVLPHARLVDIGFLALVGAVMLGHYFDAIYPRFFGQHLDVLGAIGLVHVVVLTLTLERRVAETGWGFWPNGREWAIGALHYAGFVVVGTPLAWGLKAIEFSGRRADVWVIAGTFFGFLWVSSLADEFLFRGVLQQWMEDWSRSRTAALVGASVIFGLAHLWFRGFPNWKWVPLATVLGLFCGHARNQAGGIRASAVMHALVVTTWRALLG
jgi:hypothetical protein